MLKYIVKIFIANKRFPSEVYVFLTDSSCTPNVLLILCLSEICTRFDVFLSTTKVECSLFLELDQSITLILVLSVCVAKEFISILWKTFSRTCKIFSDTIIRLKATRVRSAPSKLLIFSECSQLKVA